MTPELGLLIGQLLLKYGPTIAQQVATLFSKTEHTLQDWVAIFDSVRTYEQMDAESKDRAAAAAGLK